MTYIRSTPQPLLNSTGQSAVFPKGGEIYLLEPQTGASRKQALPHPATTAALDPAGRFLVLSGEKQLSLWDIHRPAHRLAQAALPVELYRLAIGANGLIVGIGAEEEEKASCVWAWQGQELTPMWGNENYSLGALYVDGMSLSETPPRLLTWGLSALVKEREIAGMPFRLVEFSEAFNGKGKRFAGLLNLSPEPAQVWAGEHALPEPNGFLSLLGGRAVGVYDLEKLVVLQADDPAQVNWQPVADYPLEQPSLVVASPDGSRLAGLWVRAEGEKLTQQVKSIRLNTASSGALSFEVSDQATFSQSGDFPALAVDNQGKVTLLYGEKPNYITVLRLEQGKMITRARFNLV